MAAPRRRVARVWWRAPVLRRASRRRAELLLLAAALAALVVGSGAGLAVRAVGSADGGAPAHLTTLGPVSLDLPAALGPWSTVTDAEAQDLLDRTALGRVEINGIWGALAPGSLVVTVLTAQAGTHGGVDQFRESVPTQDPAEWSGGREHASGAQVRAGVREMVLVTEAGDGDLVILSVSGPPDAFASGALTEVFRSARVE